MTVMVAANLLAATLDTVDVWMLVAIVALVLVLAFLAVAETGVGRISRVRAQSLVDETGSKSAVALARLVAEPEQFLNPVLLAVNVAQTGQAFLACALALRLFGVWGGVVAFLVDVVLLYVVAEALPKTWAVLSPDRAALFAARPVSGLVAFTPLRYVSRALIGFTNVIIPGRGLRKGPFVSEQELLGIVDAAVEDEVIADEERELIESIITFGDTVAREVMVPRPDMVTVPVTSTVTHALDVAIEHGFSRLPVIGASVDDVVGIAYTKDLVRAEREGRGSAPVRPELRPAKFLPETKPLARLMREMQAEKFHLAILVDEYGGTAGLVSLEDCLEELVGDIVDEYDREVPEVEHMADGQLRVEGGLGIDELNELVGLSLPDDDWDTVGGFVFGTLGHVPDEGESFEHDGYRFVAEKLEGRRIAFVRVTPVADGEGRKGGADRGPDLATERAPDRAPDRDDHDDDDAGFRSAGDGAGLEPGAVRDAHAERS